MRLPRFIWAGMGVGALALAWKGFAFAVGYAMRFAT